MTGCISPPKPKIAELKIEPPDRWAASEQVYADFEPQLWTKDFADPKLESIVGEALAHNYDLEAAEARLAASLAGSVASRSVVWPTLSANASGSQSRRNSASGIQQTPTAETYGLSARFNWEIDLWGRLRNAYRGALADGQAAIADYEGARLSIAARSAKAWYDAIEGVKQYELEQRILAALESAAQIVEENFERGIAGALDVRLVRANLASSQSALEQRRRSRDAAKRNLETLLGRYPANELAIVSDLPDIGRPLPVGLPSQLLLRRPDVIAAERRLAAAEQRRFEASKARLPSVDLSLSRGTNSSEPGDTFSIMENRIWSQSLNIAQTLFSGFRLKANADRARALYEQSVAEYTQAVLIAYREVENALGNQSSFEADYQHLQIAATQSIEAEKLAWEEYAAGLSDITTALDAVRRSINAQRSLIQVANQRIQSRIDLYLALGGGFEIPPAPES